MRKSVLITLTVLLLLLTGALVYYYLHPRNSSDLKVTIEKLVTRIDSEQNKKDTGFFPRSVLSKMRGFIEVTYI